MSAPSTEFRQFARLPTELREHIWQYCLPNRVWELMIPIDNCIFSSADNTHGPWQCDLQNTCYANGSPPTISRVCRESRTVAFRAGSTLRDPDDGGRRPEDSFWSYANHNRVWVDPVRDSAHLNWTDAYEPEWDYDGESEVAQRLSRELGKDLLTLILRSGILLANSVVIIVGHPATWLL